MKKQTKTSGWTKEKREQARLRCLDQKPWDYATGPRSDEGKEKSSQNAYKHGGYDADMVMLCQLLAEHSRFLKGLMAKI